MTATSFTTFDWSTSSPTTTPVIGPSGGKEAFDAAQKAAKDKRDAEIAAGITKGADALTSLATSYLQVEQAKNARRAADNAAAVEQARASMAIQAAQLEEQQAQKRLYMAQQLKANQPQQSGGTPKWLLPAAAAGVGLIAITAMK